MVLGSPWERVIWTERSWDPQVEKQSFKVWAQCQSQESRQRTSSAATGQTPFCGASTFPMYFYLLPHSCFVFLSLPSFSLPPPSMLRPAPAVTFNNLSAPLLSSGCQCDPLGNLVSRPPPGPCQLPQERPFHPYGHQNATENWEVPTENHFNVLVTHVTFLFFNFKMWHARDWVSVIPANRVKWGFLALCYPVGSSSPFGDHHCYEVIVFTCHFQDAHRMLLQSTHTRVPDFYI